MMRKLLLAAAAAMLTHTACATPPNASDRAALVKLAADLDAVWNQGDAAAVSALYAADGSLRLDSRPFVEGRAAIKRYFEETLGRRPAGARHVTRVENIDMLTPDLALVDTHARIERDGAQVLADFHNQTLALREGDTWRFRAVRAERMAAPPKAPQADPQGGQQ